MEESKGNALDNIGDPGDLVVTRIHRPLRWQPDSHLDSGRSDHLDLQPGLWPARLIRRGRRNRRERFDVRQA